jgi:hypothetical protein
MSSKDRIFNIVLQVLQISFSFLFFGQSCVKKSTANSIKSQTVESESSLLAWAENQSTINDNLEEFLENFKNSKWSPMLRYYALVYHSESSFAEQISPSQPRMILTSKSGKQLMAFQPKSPSSKSSQLELIELDVKTRAWRFATIAFEEKKAAQFSLESQNCQNCHGQKLQPIFDHYPFWPGWYGVNYVNYGQEPYKEIENFEKFQKGIGPDTLYARLPGLSKFLPSETGQIFSIKDIHDRLVKTDYAVKMSNEEILFAEMNDRIQKHEESIGLRKAFTLVFSSYKNYLAETEAEVEGFNAMVRKSGELTILNRAYKFNSPQEYAFTNFLSPALAAKVKLDYQNFVRVNDTGGQDLVRVLTNKTLNRLKKYSDLSDSQASTSMQGTLHKWDIRELAAYHALFSQIGLGNQWQEFSLSKVGQKSYQFGNGIGSNFLCMAFRLLNDTADFDCGKSFRNQSLRAKFTELQLKSLESIAR